MTNTMTIDTPAICTTLPVEPKILTANVYFWRGATRASSRRRNEQRHSNAVSEFLVALGFDVQDNDAGHVYASKGDVEVIFDYSESCQNVYKHLRVTRAGKNSNITTIRKIAASLYPAL